MEMLFGEKMFFGGIFGVDESFFWRWETILSKVKDFIANFSIFQRFKWGNIC